MAVLETLRWLVPTAVSPALAYGLARYAHRRGALPHRARPHLALATFLFGALAGGGADYLTRIAGRLTGLDIRASVAGQGPAILFVVCLVAPLGEAGKVAATWPSFLSEHLRDAYDGVVYSALAGLGFAAVDTAVVLHQNPASAFWVVRALLAVLGHVFFAAVWGYALGRAKQAHGRRASLFPVVWLIATASHALYTHLILGRGAGAVVAVVPLLLAMAVVAWVAARDLTGPGDGLSAALAARMSRTLTLPSNEPPTLHAVREAIRRGDQPVKVTWILAGALVTLGAMVAGLSASVAFGHWAHVDFSVVDEHDAATTAPLALLGVGLLAAFPVSGFLIARASNVPTLLEPALASALAIGAVCVVLGLVAPIALVFAFAFSPIAFGLACAGAWVGLPTA